MDDHAVSRVDRCVPAPIEEDDVAGLQVALVHGGPVSELLVGGARNRYAGLFVCPLNEAGAVEGPVVTGAAGARDSDSGRGGVQCMASRPYRRRAERVNQVISVVPGVWVHAVVAPVHSVVSRRGGRPSTEWSRCGPDASAELPGYVPVFSASAARTRRLPGKPFDLVGLVLASSAHRS